MTRYNRVPLVTAARIFTGLKMNLTYPSHRDYKEVRHCKSCNKEFTATHPKQIYCSKICRHGSKRIQLGTVVQCKECSNQFAKHHGQQVFCGKDCQLISETRTKAMRSTKYRKRKPVMTDDGMAICLFCKEKFGQKRKTDQAYCSRRCQQAMANHTQYARGMSRNCKTCGTDFTLGYGSQRYCSYSCGLDVNSNVYDES